MRIIGAIPAVFIFCVLPFEYITSFFSAMKNTVLAGLISLVIFGGLMQVYIYFDLWASDVATMRAYERKLYDFGLMTKNLPVHNNNYIITTQDTFTCPDKHKTSLRTLEYLAYPNIKQYLFYRPAEGFLQISCDDPQVVFLESDQQLRDQYKNSCPDLKQKKYLYDNGKYIFWVMSNNP